MSRTTRSCERTCGDRTGTIMTLDAADRIVSPVLSLPPLHPTPTSAFAASGVGVFQRRSLDGEFDDRSRPTDPAKRRPGSLLTELLSGYYSIRYTRSGILDRCVDRCTHRSRRSQWRSATLDSRRPCVPSVLRVDTDPTNAVRRLTTDRESGSRCDPRDVPGTQSTRECLPWYAIHPRSPLPGTQSILYRL